VPKRFVSPSHSIIKSGIAESESGMRENRNFQKLFLHRLLLSSSSRFLLS